MVNAILTKEITVEMPDAVGIAAKLTHVVSQEAKANIRAAWAAGDHGRGHFSLITDNNQKVLDALRKDYPETQEHEVVVFYVPNSLGKIEEVTQLISKAGLNIDFLYTTYFEDKPAIILSTNDNKKALQLFNH